MKPDRAIGLVLLALCGAYAWLTNDIPALGYPGEFSPRSLPQILATLAFPLCLWLVIKPQTAGTDSSHPMKTLNAWLGIAFCVLMLGYAYLLDVLGFILSTTLFLSLGFALLGERRGLALGLLAPGVAFAFWWLMAEGLGVYLPAWPPSLIELSQQAPAP